MEKGEFDEPQARTMAVGAANAQPQAMAIRRRHLLDSGASHRVEWLPDGEDPADYQKVQLQLAVGEIPGYMKEGASTVFLDQELRSTPGLEEMQELLPHRQALSRIWVAV